MNGGWGTRELKRSICLKPLIRISSGKGQTFTVYHHVTQRENTVFPHFHLLTPEKPLHGAQIGSWILGRPRRHQKLCKICRGPVVPSLVLPVHWDSDNDTEQSAI